jgi:oxygen-independent coproporphyrinogen-3 oxidase
MSLLSLLEREPYAGYAYGYPHKTAYRPFEAPRALSAVWAGAEDRRRVTLYLHVPFCEMRCGFCNLFTTAHPGDDLQERYVEAVERQARVFAEQAFGRDLRFDAVVLGGGTPTFLRADLLARLLEVARRFAPDAPLAVETSPKTATRDKLAMLRGAGVTRISIGVQSFSDHEARAAGRPQRSIEVDRALAEIRALDPAILNVDLIYGIDGQTAESLAKSLDAALEWRPEEIYLYPLYVRPLTGLEKRSLPVVDRRRSLHRVARTRLRARGYEQISMRLFRRSTVRGASEIRCQEDATVGLGCGARSYTRSLHYSTEWAVGARSVREILGAYCRSTDQDFAHARYGIEVDLDEQRRRYVIKSVLRRDGLDLAAYREQFGTEARADLPELRALEEAGLLSGIDVLVPTELALELADAIGPYLYSAAIRARMAEFDLR